MTAAVIVSVRVDATPLRAFEAFTRAKAAARRDLAERSRVRGRPHHRLEAGRKARTHMARAATFASGQSTQLDLAFDAVGDQTRLTVEHRGWDEIPQDHVARHGFALVPFQRSAGSQRYSNNSGVMIQLNAIAISEVR